MKKWIIIIASVATVIIAAVVVCLGILNSGSKVEVRAGEYFEDITWDTSISDVKMKLSSRGYDIISEKIYSKPDFNDIEGVTAKLSIVMGEDQVDTYMLVFDATSTKSGISKKDLKKLKKAYEQAFDKLTDKKLTRNGSGTAAEVALGGWDECISWITENSCIELLYTKDKKLTISYQRSGTEYSELIESLIENK